MNEAFLLEGLGFLAMCCVLAIYQIERPRVQLLAFCFPNSLWGTYFFITGNFAGVLISCVNSLRNFCGATLPERYFRYAVCACIIASIVLITIEWRGFADIFPLLGALTSGISALLRDRPALYRRTKTLCEVSWVAYGIVIVSPSLMTAAGLALISLIISIARYDFGFNVPVPKRRPRVAAK